MPVSSTLAPLPPPVAGAPLWPRVNGRLPVGFNETSVGAGYLQPSQAAALGRGIAATLVRIPLNWAYTQARRDGPYDWRPWDKRYLAYVQAGIRPIWAIQASPNWAVDDPSACPFHPERGLQATNECLKGPSLVGSYAQLAAAVARRYPLSAAVEVWNEPNLAYFWRDPDPVGYARLVRATATAVHQADPAMRVLAGALSYVPRTVDSGVATTAFIGALVGSGDLGGADGLSIHPYPRWPDMRDFQGMLQTTAQALQSAPAVRVVADEIGASTTRRPGQGSFTVQQQTNAMVAAFHALDTPPTGEPLAGRVDGIAFHTDIDGGAGYGWVRPGLIEPIPQPVYCAFERLLRSSAVCGIPAPF